MNVDLVNGLFEAGGAYCTWRNAWQLHKDREIKGVYWPLTAFFTAWGVWNLWYYPALGQWFSFYAGIVLVTGNLLWVAQIIWFHGARPCPNCECNSGWTRHLGRNNDEIVEACEDHRPGWRSK